MCDGVGKVIADRVERGFQTFGVACKTIHYRALTRTLPPSLIERYGEQERCDDRRGNQAVCQTRYDTEQLVDGAFVNTFREPAEKCVAEKLDRHAGGDSYKNECDWTVPNIRPQVNAWSEPTS